MTVEINNKAQLSSNDLLLDAWKKTNDSWIPANPQVIDYIREKVNNGQYVNNFDELLTDVKSDVSVFTYCIKRLSELLTESESKSINPLELLKQASADEVKFVLDELSACYSSKSFDQLNSLQAARLQESLVSAATSEKLAASENIEASVCFSASILRQLGLALVAWNYPQLYAQAVAQLQNSANPDKVFNKVLGFSPQILGIAFARKWNLIPELRAALGDDKAKQELEGAEAEEKQSIASKLELLCEIGESLARAQQPNLYPSARSDWLRAKHEIESRLGIDGISIIYQHAEKYYSKYKQQAPELFTELPKTELEQRFESASPEVLLEDNRFIHDCPPHIKWKLREIYKTLPVDRAGTEQIRLLTRQIMPEAGFESGCVFVYDPSSLMLIPRLTIGTSELKDFKALDPDTTDSANSIVLWAFDSTQPIVQDVQDSLTRIAGAYGIVQRAGVVLAEANKEALQQQNLDPKMIFEAFRYALMACLRLY